MNPLPPEVLRRRAQEINHGNADTHHSAEQALGVVAALVLAIVGAVLLVHYLTPCDTGTLCMAAVVTRTSSGRLAWLHRQVFCLRALCRAWYLRRLIAAAEADLRYMQHDLHRLPALISFHRMQIDVMQLRLASAEIDARGH